ncbi:type II secretion system protein M [Steroidobacter sp.]|uniref:type II secretion system protein M n=1 Tax=Steroidobacter sp. TaxID=1978227 RepID=UPI001A3D02BB|nr:type II secretion system protein M [Steroidobacter sp.]MBL8266761.1 type II secretion system protein M [Steroidobacter sp.]
MQQLKDKFNALQPRERIVIIGGAVLVLVVAIYTLALAPLYAAVGAQAKRVAQKEGDLAWMRSVAGEVAVLSAAAPSRPGPSNESLVVLIDRAARDCGLGSSLTGQTPNGDHGIRVRLEAAEFDKLMVCLGTLQQVHAVDVESATIDRTAKPGLVNANLVLTRVGV